MPQNIRPQEDIYTSISDAIDHKSESLAQTITDKHFTAHPELEKRYGPIGKVKCLEDARYHLKYLSEAVRAESQLLFAEYCTWAKQLLAYRNIPDQDLQDNLTFIYEALYEQLSPEMSSIACKYVETALQMVRDLNPTLSSVLEEKNPHGLLAREYLNLLLEGNRQAASRFILNAVQGGIKVKEIYRYIFQPSQYEVGRLWQPNRISVAQEHYCTAATQLIMAQLYQHVLEHVHNGHKLLATCAEGDYHEMGIRMVSDFFELEGWDTYFLGANTPTASVVKTAGEMKPDIILISSTMTFHVRAVANLIRSLRANEQTKDVKIMVGGYPFKLAPDLWQKVGADASAGNAWEAVATAEKLIKPSERNVSKIG